MVDRDTRKAMSQADTQQTTRRVRRKRRPGIVYRPKSPDASLERLRQLAGIIALSEPITSVRFDEDDDDCRPADHASD